MELTTSAPRLEGGGNVTQLIFVGTLLLRVSVFLLCCAQVMCSGTSAGLAVPLRNISKHVDSLFHCMVMRCPFFGSAVSPVQSILDVEVTVNLVDSDFYLRGVLV